MINKVRAFFLRLFYKSHIVKLQEHPAYKGKLFSKVKRGNDYYYHVGDYEILKSKKQHGYTF